LNYETHTIVGVMPPGFDFPFGRAAPFWTPMVFEKETADLYPMPITSRARLKKGVTPEKASAELTVLASRLRNVDSSVQTDGRIVHVRRLLDAVVEGHRRLPLLLLGAAGFVLLIACGNAASLFLARAAVRQREIAMRVALGASRSRILRQMLTESLLLSLAAGVLGLALTFCTVKGLVRMCPSDIPRLQETSVDLSVLGFALGTSVLTSLLFGMMPARRASGIRANEALKEATERAPSGRAWHRLHDGLVVSQLALSLVLLIGAALLIRSLIAVQKLDLGFRPENVLAAEIRLPEAKYPESEHCTAFFDELLRRVQGLPHVRSAALAFDHLQLGATEWDITISVPDHPPASPKEIPRAKRQFVTPGYFQTMGIRLLRGRPLTEEDDAYTVLADEKLVRKLFPNTDPIGQTLIHDNGELVMTIVGVTSTTRDFQTTDPADGALYWRLDGSYQNMILVARGDADPLELASAVRTQVASLEKDEVIHRMEPLKTTLSTMLAPRRFGMVLLSLFAGIALILATVGVYGLLHYSTAQQTHDIGIRMALGARKVDVLKAVLTHGLKLTLIGVVCGLAGAVALTRVLSSFLYDVTPTDPLTLAVVSVVLTVVAVLASYVPARRAARIDPMVALRYE
jgi:putative ABC transport system permease protein